MLPYRKKIINTSLACVFSLSVSFSVSAQEESQDELEDVSFEELMDIEVVSASKQSQKLTDAPAIISVISATQIRQRGYQSVGEALQSLPGVDVLKDHLKDNTGIRGINAGMRGWSRIVKVMIDGQPISFRSSTENFLGPELIPIQVIERIEVIRGPGSALYGANAFLGVINIITKTGEKISGGQLSGQLAIVQSNPGYQGELLYGTKSGDVDVVVAGSYQSIDRSGLKIKDLPEKTKYSTSSLTQNDLAQPASGYAKISYANETIGNISIDTNYQLLNSFGEFQDWGVLTHKNQVALQNFYARSRYSKDFSENWSSNFSFSYATGGNMPFEKLFTNQVGFGDFLTRKLGYNSFDLTLDTIYKVDRHSLTLGADFTSDNQILQTFSRNFSDRPTEVIGEEQNDRLFTNYGVFLQGIIYPFEVMAFEPLKNMGFTSGLRFDGHNIYGNVFNYRVASIFPLNQYFYSKLMYGTSFKAPAASQLFTGSMIPGGVVGNPNLKPERANTLELLVGSEIIKGLNVNLNGFLNTIDDKVELVKNPLLSSVNAENFSQINSVGAEAEVLYRFQNLSNYANFSYQTSTVKETDPIKGEVSRPTRLYPAMMFKFGSNYHLPEAFLNFNLEGRYVSSRIASNQNITSHDPVNFDPYTLNPYFILDFTISTDNLKFFAQKETFIQLKASNLLDQEYYFPGFKDYDIPGLGRNIMLKFTQSF